MNLNLSREWKIEKVDGVIVPMYEDELEFSGMDLPLKALQETKRFEGKFDTQYTLTQRVDDGLCHIVLIGLGKRGEITYRKLLNVLGNGVRGLTSIKAKRGVLLLTDGKIVASETFVKAAVEASIMADYVFDDFKTGDEPDRCDMDFTIVVDEADKYDSVFEEAEVLATANLVARDLVNQPANVMNAVTLAQRVEDLGAENGFSVEVKGLDEIQALQMDAFLAVARASEIEPRLIVMRYMGDSDSDERLGLVGKGLTYDAGGLSIKSTESMARMKGDMGGAAAVIGAMCAISEARLKRNVIAVVAACENMISGSSYRPGDIISSMAGKSIYIGNTDAEGRLTLVDAMHYMVTKEKATKLVDIATLTGAALHCTGAAASVAIASDDRFFNDVKDAFSLSGEQIWRMPIFDEYKAMLKHEEADLTNTPGKPGTITAGLFIGEFTQGLPWVHIDIAGTSMTDQAKGILSRGGTGAGVRPLYYLAKA